VAGVDSAPVTGPIRAYSLLVLSLLMTVTLIQLVYLLFRDEARPRLWPWWLFGRLLRRRSSEPISTALHDPTADPNLAR